MLRSLFCLLFTFSFFFSQANNIEKAWDALNKQDRAQARKLLESALKNDREKMEATLILTFLNTMEFGTKSMELMQDILPDMEEPSPYLYALWFEDAVTGGSYVSDKKRAKFIEEILNNEKVNESVKGAGYYSLGMYYLWSNQYQKSKPQWDNIGSIKDWQLLGPFENNSGSAFHKPHPPLEQPGPDAVFKSKVGHDIKWFTPSIRDAEGWITTEYSISGKPAGVYLQSFVTSPTEQEVVLSLGGSGQLKIWLNDVLVLEQEEELRTDMDLFRRKVKLKKGVNRILVFNGYTYETTYPNFIVRFLDNNGKPITNLEYSAQYQKYNKGTTADIGEKYTHFAEAYFKNKIKEDPKNILNYLLLFKTYERCEDSDQAIRTILQAIEIAPENPLLQQAFLEGLIKHGNRTELLRQIEKMRALDPELPLLWAYDLEISFDNEEYEKAEKLINKIKPFAGEKSSTYYDYIIRLQSGRKEYVKLIDTVKEAFKEHPDNSQYLLYNYNIVKNTNPDPEAPARLLEDYLKDWHTHSIIQKLVSDYSERGKKDKAEKWLKRELEVTPYELSVMSQLVNLYYRKEEYKKALDMVEQELGIAPYNAPAWKDKGYIYEAMNKKNEAIESFEKALLYNPNLFDERRKIRELKGEKNLVAYFEKKEPYQEIETYLENPISSDNNFEYIFYEENTVLYPSGANFEYYTMALRTANESGVDYWKEASIGYGRNQRLYIDKAEVIKKNGERVPGETNNNQIVFTSLEVGDVVYLIYRMETYAYSQLDRDFATVWNGNAFVPMQRSLYRLLVPEGMDINISESNMPTENIKKNIEGYNMYIWDLKSPEICKDEIFMPTLTEVGNSTAISTFDSWKDISNWYQDLGLPIGKEDYIVDQAYENIFGEKTYADDLEKAKAIYNYIHDNVRYSHVDFRQSSYVPQKPGLTLSTQLGDCKDVSLLYHTLAKRAGLETHLVLVNSRENGYNTMRLPMMNFNHCIIEINLNGQQHFQELTSDKLPFGATPNSLIGSQALVIPNNDAENIGAQLIHIPASDMVPAEMHRKTEISFAEDDLIAKTKLTATGDRASSYRYHFLGLTQERTKENMEDLLDNEFNNHLELGEFSFENLESREHEFSYTSNFSVENELVKMGGLKAVKIPFFEVIYNLDNFPNEERKYPLEYCRYENTDKYITEVILTLPDGVNIIELPAALNIDNQYIKYDLTVEEMGDQKIKVLRKVTTKKDDIPADKYTDFRETVKKIIEAEDQFVVFK